MQGFPNPFPDQPQAFPSQPANPAAGHGVHAWTGHYEQFGQKNNVSIDDFRINNDGTIVGGGKDGVGNFKITGKLTGNDVHFDKAYQGAHTVKYTGNFKDGGITGKWDVPGANGGFEIRSNKKQWKGHYVFGGSKTDMTFYLDLQENKGHDGAVSGLGSDPNGNYSIEGTIPKSGNGHIVNFNKTYFGQAANPVHYTGIVFSQNNQQVIKGNWFLPNGNMHGEFELTKQA